MQNNEEFSASSLPKAQGLYDPAYEKDACGGGFCCPYQRQTF